MKKLFTFIAILFTGYMASASCHAGFTTSTSAGTVTFTNTSTPPTYSGVMAKYANWDFGDGGYSSSWNTSHTYTAAGTYTVKLYVEWVDSASSSYICDDTFATNITVTSPTGVSGDIFRDSTLGTFGMDSMYVWLITVDTTTHIITAVDSEIVPAWGSYAPYSFTGVAPGDYLVKASSMFTPSGSGFVPTYHLSSLHWNTAGYVTVTSGTMTTGNNINMQYGTVTSGAPGFIAGDVRYGAGKTTYTIGDPVVGLTIFVTNSSTGKLVSSGKTDATGHYSINVPLGTYNITPEQGGLVSTAWTNVTVSTAATTSDHNNFKQNSSSIKPDPTAVPEVNTAANINIYPNPAHNVLSIQWNNSAKQLADINITNVTGQNVLHTSVIINTASTDLNISALQPGLYFVHIQSGNNNYNQKVVIE